MEIGRAHTADAQALTETSVRAFHDDARRFGGVATDADLFGPPGFDRVDWHLQMMKKGRFFTIWVAGEVVGGMVVMPRGNVCHLGRIWVDPRMQGRGIGRAAIEWLHAEFPDARKWTLDTPRFAVRNQRLYESLGYRKVGETTVENGFRIFLYEREPA